MPESNAPLRTVRLPDDLPPRERLKILLRAKGHSSIASWARKRGFHESQVWMCLSGEREYPQIRDALAEDLELPRLKIDQLIQAA